MNELNFFINKLSSHNPQPTEETRSSLSSTEEIEESTKISQVGTKTLFHKIAEGAVKLVWVKGSSIPPDYTHTREPEKVYYTAKDSFFNRKEKELKQEFQKMKDIESNVKVDTTHLAVGGKEVEQDRIEGKFTLEVDKISGDFEKILRDSNTSLDERIHLGHQFLDGLENLHKADYAYGDMKPDNCLIYGKKEKLKIGDFGKSESIPAGAPAKAYKGNTRYAPPEGLTSKKGDVYGAAMVLIRNFEEACLQDKTCLMEMKGKPNFDREAVAELRGVEKYVVEHNAFLACNPGFSIVGTKNRLKMGKMSESEMQAQTEAMHGYIDKLEKELMELPEFSDNDKAPALCELLKLMTAANPKARISSKEAAATYRRIFNIADSNAMSNSPFKYNYERE